MAALVPRYDEHLSPQIMFGQRPQMRHRSRDYRLIGSQAHLSSFYPAQTYYPPPLNLTSRYLTTGYNQFGQSGMNTTLSINSNRLNDQYQYQLNQSYMNHIQNGYAEQQTYTKPLCTYTRLFPTNYTVEPQCPVADRSRLKVHQDVNCPGQPRFGAQAKLGFNHPSNLGYAGWPASAAANRGRVRNLSPKHPRIFIPPGSSSLREPCVGPLDVPPFVFDRIPQSSCSLAFVPPPLPQVESMYLPVAFQQMVMRRYVSPYAVFPYAPNWRMSQPVAPDRSQISGQRQQTAMPMPNFQSRQSTLIPGNMTVSPGQIPPPLLAFRQMPQLSPYYKNGYSRPYRVYPQPSASRNIPPVNHSWMQYHSAYYPTPAATGDSNIRETNKRIKRLFRDSRFSQDLYNDSRSEYPFSYMNGSFASDPWLYNMPPLPPGAVLISDKYLNTEDLFYGYGDTPENQYQCMEEPSPMTTTETGYSVESPRSQSARRPIRNDSDASKIQSTTRSNSTGSSPTSSKPKVYCSCGLASCSECNSTLYSSCNPSACSFVTTSTGKSFVTTSTGKSVEPTKSVTAVQDNKENVDDKQSSIADVQSNYQPSDASGAPNTDPNSKLNDEHTSMQSVDPDALRRFRISLAMKNNQTNSSKPTQINLTQEEEKAGQRQGQSTLIFPSTSSSQYQSKQFEPKLCLMADASRSSGYTSKTTSRTTLYSPSEKDTKSTSGTYMSYPDRHYENNLSLNEMY